ncbi:MAG: VCBS repeat-containing protein [Planctomycetes bacterium]|nr:VCBS repeat-containing protein [Planctomycetota bacterium]MCB9870909.1 VCBS repeat-containing protein [Planctomycetota bacterium]
MRHTSIPFALCLAAAVAPAQQARSTQPMHAPEFAAPTQVEADGVPVRTENPGYACPCWADVDGDGRADLVVGQFAGGKMKWYRNLGKGKLGKGQWIEVDGKVAEVPGVW